MNRSSDRLSVFLRYFSYYLMGYRQPPFGLIRICNKRQWKLLRANSWCGSLNRGVFSENNTLRDNIDNRSEQLYLWPYGMRWHYLYFSLIIVMPVFFSNNFIEGLVFFNLNFIFIPMMVFWVFRLPVLDFMKERTPYYISKRLCYFPDSKDILFALFGTLTIIYILYFINYLFYTINNPSYSNYIINICLWSRILFNEIYNSLILSQDVFIKNIDDICFTIFIITFYIVVFFLIYCVFNITYFIFLKFKTFFSRCLCELTEFYFPKTWRDCDSVFYNPMGSFKESIIKLAIIEFYENKIKDHFYYYIWTNRSFYRFIFYWCSPVWGSYIILHLMLLYFSFFYSNQQVNNYLIYSGVLWMAYSSYFLWVESQNYNEWINILGDDYKMMPSVLIGKIKERPVFAHKLLKSEIKFIIQIINGIAFAVFLSILD